MYECMFIFCLTLPLRKNQLGSKRKANNHYFAFLLIFLFVLSVPNAACLNLPPCNLGLPPKLPNHAAGFYYKDIWHSKVCRARQPDLTETLKCLRNKRLYFYGDSTIRQWFIYLVANLGSSMKEAKINSTSANRAGLRRARDTVNNITLFFRHHEYPILNEWINVSDIKFTVNELDALPGGKDTVVLFTLFAHFTSTNLTYYQSRLENIKAAISRLEQRGEGVSPVFFKSANTRGVSIVDYSDLYAYELDQTMRAIFTGVPHVTIIDTWDMTVSHRSGYRIHPINDVIREEVQTLLSFICKSTSH